MRIEKGRKTEAKGVKPETTDASNGEQRTNDIVPKVKVTVGGMRPPSLYHDNLKPPLVATFCQAYKAYTEQIEIANKDGEERTPACLRELVPKPGVAFSCVTNGIAASRERS